MVTAPHRSDTSSTTPLTSSLFRLFPQHILVLYSLSYIDFIVDGISKLFAYDVERRRLRSYEYLLGR